MRQWSHLPGPALSPVRTRALSQPPRVTEELSQAGEEGRHPVPDTPGHSPPASTHLLPLSLCPAPTLCKKSEITHTRFKATRGTVSPQWQSLASLSIRCLVPEPTRTGCWLEPVTGAPLGGQLGSPRGHPGGRAVPVQGPAAKLLSASTETGPPTGVCTPDWDQKEKKERGGGSCRTVGPRVRGSHKAPGGRARAPGRFPPARPPLGSACGFAEADLRACREDQDPPPERQPQPGRLCPSEGHRATSGTFLGATLVGGVQGGRQSPTRQGSAHRGDSSRVTPLTCGPCRGANY